MNKKPPLKPTNLSRRSREFLFPKEVDLVIKAAKNLGRHGHRDSAMILIAYRHALRVSELVHLKWQQIDLNTGMMQVNRLKNGINSQHPIWGVELRALRRIKKDYPLTDYVFVSERGTPMTTGTFRKVVARAGIAADIDLPIHPHMLRHSAGYKLANDSQDTRSIQQYLGHKNIRHTSHYTNVSTDKFKEFWND